MVLAALVDMLAVDMLAVDMLADVVVGAIEGWSEGAPEYVLERTSSRMVEG